MCQKAADGVTNSVGSDQTAPEIRSSLIFVYTVCSDLFVPILGNITVNFFREDSYNTPALLSYKR